MSNVLVPEFVSVDQAIEWASKLYQQTEWKLQDIDLQLVNDIMRQFRRLATDFPILAESLTFLGLSDRLNTEAEGHGTMAAYEERAGAIHLNKKFWLDKEKLSQSTLNCMINMWLPLVEDRLASLITHEFAHAVYEAFEYSGQYTEHFQNWRQSQPLYVCEYAKTNEKELFACTLTSYYHDEYRHEYVKKTAALAIDAVNLIPSITRTRIVESEE